MCQGASVERERGRELGAYLTKGVIWQGGWGILKVPETVAVTCLFTQNRVYL